MGGREKRGGGRREGIDRILIAGLVLTELAGQLGLEDEGEREAKGDSGPGLGEGYMVEPLTRISCK